MKNKKKLVSIILSLILLITGIMLIGSIFLISGIENAIRYAGMFVILLLDFLVFVFFVSSSKKEKKGTFIAFLVITCIFILVNLILSYFIYKTYNTLDNMNKNKVTYTSVVAVLENSDLKNLDNFKDEKIGIVADTTSIDGYVIGTEIIKEKNLDKNNTVVEYENFSTLVKDLYDKKIDAMIISGNYPSMFKSNDKYKNIESETRVIYEKSKTLTKSEIAKYTGDDIVNLNSDDKITKPFTVLVMGIDSTAQTLDKNATGNGDALMLITFNPDTLNATILSIPRDTYVPIACFAGKKENKITHAAWNGESCMIKTIENFTNINIDYYVKVNFQGVVKLVNALDGISVDVPMEFCESNSKRSTKSSNLICLKKGKQTLNGEQALALARHRKTLQTGDLQRGVNQQLVVQGILNKVKSIKSANQMLNILDTISNNMDTNFTTKQILSFYDIAKKLLLTNKGSNLINMQQLYLQGSGQLIYDEGMGLNLYNYIVNKESLELVTDEMKRNLGLLDVTPVKKMDFSIDKVYKMKTIGADVSSGTTTYTLLPSFVGNSEGYATSWLSSNGVSYTIKTREVSSGYDGMVLEQSYPAGKRVDLISGSVVLTVSKVKKVVVTPKKDTNSNKNNNTSDNTKDDSNTSDNTSDNNDNADTGDKGDNSGSSEDDKIIEGMLE